MLINDIFISKAYADMLPVVAAGNLSPVISDYGILDAAAILLVILAVTVIVELLTFLVLNQSLDRRRVFKTVLIMNLISNPIVNVLYYILQKRLIQETLVLIVLLEVGVVLFEAFFIKKFLSLSFVRSFIYSLILNTTSFVIGTIVSNMALVLYFVIKGLIFGTGRLDSPTPANITEIAPF